MIWIYAASALFGGVFLVPMLLSGLDIGDTGLDAGPDLEADLDAGTGLDLGAEVDVDVDVGEGPSIADVAPGEGGAAGSAIGDASGGPLGAIAASLLSFRTVVFFTAFFGSAGLVLSAIGYGSVLTAVTAALLGGFAAAANSVLFGLVRSSEANSQISDRTFHGRMATVVLPMGGGHPGRVRVDLGGQPQYLVARPVDDGTEQRFDVGASVVVVEIENGTAMVASLTGLDSGEES